ncbi:MAG TPA: hypothetical protein DCQ98_05405 [Planctomycetaceae bacterium]|nr:hypothetical protein [Planctomycetaceae bacterium]
MPETSEPTLGSTSRSVISLLLVIHLFAIAITFFSVLEPAPLQQRLLGILAPYLQLMNFDLDYAPYYLTRDRLHPDFTNEFREREYRVEALPRGADPNDATQWFKVGADWTGSSESYRRIQRLAYIPVVAEREERQAEVAGNLARLAERLSGQPVGRIRILQHIPVPREYYEVGAEIDPNSAEWFRRSYEALVVDGAILPVVDQREAAGGSTTGGSNTSGGRATDAPSSPSTPSEPSGATPLLLPDLGSAGAEGGER